MADLSLYPHQKTLLRNLREGFAAHRVQMLYGPCGAGKTELAAAMMKAVAGRGLRATMIVDLTLLCHQTSARLTKYGIDHGVIMPDSPRYRPEQNIQVAMVQTIEARQEWPDTDLLIVDEAHSLRASVTEFIQSRPKMEVVGLSGSPFTRGLGATYTNVVSGITINELVAESKLIYPKIFIAKPIDMEGAKKVAGEWSDKEVATRGAKITGDIVAEWQNKTMEIFGKPAKTIVFCAGIAHGAGLANKFADAGLNFIALSHKSDPTFRAEAIAEFAKVDSCIHGLIATDLLTKGFDVCILEGSKVLTDSGLVSIDKLSINAKVWDGTEFVNHGGAIYKGVKHVITYAGLTATLDHKVKTKYGWMDFGHCAKNNIRIIKTGDGGKEIFERDNLFSSCNKGSAWESCKVFVSLQMRTLQQGIYFCMAGDYQSSMAWLSKLQRYFSLPDVVGSQMREHEGKVRKSISQGISELWRPWNKIQFRFSTGCRELDCKEFGASPTRQQHPIGQDKQRWELRAWESSVGYKTNAKLQYATGWVGSVNAQIQTIVSKHKIFRQNIQEFIKRWIDLRSNNRKVQSKITQAEGRVWDILNCGPRNSFTCEGLLVHNCDVSIMISARPFSKSFSSHVQQMGRIMRTHITKDSACILDHSGNFLRFRYQWDALCEEGVSKLDDGAEKTKPEPTEKEREAAKCPVCHALWPGNSDLCTHCGHVRQRRNEVIEVAGQLFELDNKKKEPQYSAEYKEAWYKSAIAILRKRGKNEDSAYYL